MTNAILVVQTISILVLASLVVGVLRSHGRLLKILHDAGFYLDTTDTPSPLGGRRAPSGSGREATDVAGVTLSGASTAINVVGATHPTLLAFLSSGCSSCQVFWSEMGSAMRSLPGEGTRLVVVTKGPEAESPSRLGQLAPPDVKLVQSTTAWDDYQVPITPYFVLVDGGTGKVAGEGSATSWKQVFSLLGQAVDDVSVSRARPIRFGRRDDGSDDALRRAGIGPDHPSLRPPTEP